MTNDIDDANPSKPPTGSSSKPYSCPSFSMGDPAPGAELTKANQLAAALEDEELIRKLRQGR